MGRRIISQLMKKIGLDRKLRNHAVKFKSDPDLTLILPLNDPSNSKLMARWMVHIEQQIMTVQFRGTAWIKIRIGPFFEFLT